MTLTLCALVGAERLRADDPPEPPSAQLTREEAEDHPDLPGFLDGTMNMEEYFLLRSQATSEYRGLPFTPTRRGAANPRSAAIRSLEAKQRRQRALTASAPGGLPPPSWEPVGPAPIPNGQTTTRADPVSGRVTAIAVDPLDASIAYVGTAQGGVYRTLDGGDSWTAIFDQADSLAVGAIAVAPSDRDVVYVGTGEANLSGDSFFGVGLYRIDSARTTASLTGPINPVVATTGIANTRAFTGRSISKILVHPTSPGTIFVSTATGMAGIGGASLEGASMVPPLAVLGLYRSTNADTATPAFQKLALGLPTSPAVCTIVTPSCPPRLLPTDARSENSRITDLVLEPGNANVLLVAVYGGPPQGGSPNEGGIYRSANALAATPAFLRTLSLSNATRVEFAINKVGATVNVVAATGEATGVAACTTASHLGAVRSSATGGLSWSARLAGGLGFCGGQCTYNIAVGLDPNDASRIYLGGAANGTCSRVYVRSTDGGASFADSDEGLHADTHALAVAPSDPSVVYIGNDGGIWKSTDAAQTWTSLNNTGFNATQFQSLALHPVDRELMIGGTQDNGTQLRRADGTWFRADYGDGGFALIDQSTTDTEDVTAYHTYFNQSTAMGFGRVSRISDARDDNWEFFGCGFGVGTINGLNCASTTGILFYAPMALGPGAPNTLYFGSDRLFRSTDRGETMTAVSQDPIQTVGILRVPVSAISVSPQDDDVRVVGMRFGKVFATATGGSPLVDVTGPWPVSANLASQPRRFVSRVVVDPNDKNVAYVAFATYCAASGTPTPGCAQVYKTTNLVTALLASAVPAWSAASTGLPDIPVSAFVVDPRDSNHLFAGTDIGVFESTSGGASWAPYGTGFPRVAVFDLALHVPTGTLRAATHGRGLWEIAAGQATPSFSSLSSPTIGLGGSPTVVTGTLRAGSLVPPGSVLITLAGSTQAAAIDPATGFFSAALATGALAAGSYPIDYAFAGAPGYGTAAGQGTLTISASLSPTTLSLTAPTAPYPDAAVTVTVTSPAGTPSGDVTLSVNGGTPFTLSLSGGTAVLALPTLPPGTHSLLARYEVQGAFGSSALVGSLVVTKGLATLLASSPAIALGQTPTTLSGTLRSGAAVPTGSVQITLDGATQFAVLDPGTGAFSATFATGALATGVHAVSYDHPGDLNFDPVSAGGALVVAMGSTTTFTNPATIAIGPTGLGDPYPSVINVSGLFGKVLKATVTLKGVTDLFPDDSTFLLVAPDGSTTALLYHVGGTTSLVAGDLAFDDAGPLAPLAGPLASGTYRPTQNAPVVSLPAGGSPDPPAAPYGASLFAHNGTSPNGAWRLYYSDDALPHGGLVASGWELTLTTAGEPAVVVGDVTVAEGAPAVFAVSLDAPPTFAVDVDYATASGTAVNGVDLASTTGTVHFDPFETTQTIAVPTLPDLEGELAETFFVNLTNPRYARLQDAQGRGTITDDDPHATIGDVQKPEGSIGTTSFVYTVRLNVAPAVPVSVAYRTESLGAAPGIDYTTVSGVLSFAPGQTARSFTVPVVAERLEEMDEFFKVVLSSASGLYLDRVEALGWIVNDDFVGPPRLRISDATLVEGAFGSANMAFTVSLSRVGGSVVTLRYATANSTATAGSDYTARSGSLSFPVGTTVKTILVPVLGDGADEADETFFVSLSSVRGAAVLDGQGQGTIRDDDP